jgi:flagellar hook-associated protein 2
LYTGSKYRIQITGTESGSSNAITFGETGTLDMQLTEYVAAKDAQIEVDGYTITSDTNTFDDVLDGVTLNVNETTATSFQLEVKADTSKIEETINGFIEGYNSVITLIKADTTSNSTLRNLQLQMGTMIANQIGDVGGVFSALSQIGISTGSDGKLSLDSDDLKEALASDTRGVAKLFAGSDDETVSGIGDLLDSFIDRYVSSVDGVLKAQQSGLQNMITNLADSIMQAEERVNSYEDGLVEKFTAMEITLSQLNSQMSYMSSMML